MTGIGTIQSRYIPFATLEIANSIRENKTVARADCFNDTASYVVFSTT